MSGILCAAPGTLRATATASNITFVSSAVGKVSLGTSVSVTMPTIAAGDVALITINRGRTATAWATTPTGFTQLFLLTNGTQFHTTVWYKVLAGTESGTVYTASLGGLTTTQIASIVVYRGVNASPFDATTTTQTNASNTTHTLPSITTVTAGTKVLRVLTTSGGSLAAISVTPPASPAHTERFDDQQQNSSSLPWGVEISDYTPGSTGATGTVTATSSQNATSIAATIALKPA